MKVWVNGQVQELPPVNTVADLAAWMNLPAYGVAIELNGEVVRRNDHAITLLAEGDRLEVVRLVGGG